ncbi:hypothetical protein GWO14_08935 [candidate division KSB1 bacterium]|nr:hypothetical protein [candidate division KSB1 bacterium]
MSRKFVTTWTQDIDMDFAQDARGWEKGRRRVWDEFTEQRIREIFDHLESDPNEFFSGATAIRQHWLNQYGDNGIPPLRTIGQIMKDLGLTQPYRKSKAKGAASYLCYPEHCIHTVMGQRVLELDFVGKKFLKGHSAPLNFIGFSFKHHPKLRYFERIKGQSGDEIINHSRKFFELFEKPDAIKMDNGFAMAGSAPQPGIISRVPLWMLSQKITPIYAVPRKPFTQASIEGNNSVFSRKFWNARQFDSVEHVDQLLPVFNNASIRYAGYTKSDCQEISKSFDASIYFIRQVKLLDEKASIELAHQRFTIPNEYVNYFVFARWQLEKEQVKIFIEKNKKPELIANYPFKINPISKQKLEKIFAN